LYPFKKLVRLPSNGLSYPAIVEINHLTNAFLYATEDSLFQNNLTENKASSLQPYVSFSLYEMYYSDLLFLWNYFMVITFKKTDLIKNEICRNCKTENIISIPLDKLDIVYLEDKQEILSFDFLYNSRIMTVYYRRRKTIDNIESSLDNLELQNALNNINDYTAYFSKLFFRQIVKIVYEDQTITEITDKILFEIFSYHSDKIELINLFYEKLIEFNDFGIMNNIWYVCKNCETKNKANLFDVISDSFYITNISESKKDFLAFLSFIKAGFISFTEVMKLPIVLNKDFFDECLKIAEKENSSGDAVDYRKFHGLG
jgi:hypothetical protein